MNGSLMSWSRGIRGKLLFAALLPLFGFAALYYVAHSNMNELGQSLASSNSDIIPSLDALGNMREARNSFGYQIYAALYLEDPAQKKERLGIAKKAVADIKKAVEDYEAFPFTPEGERLWAPSRPIREDYYAKLEKVISLIEQEKPEEASLLMQTQVWEYGKIMNKVTTESSTYYGGRAKTETVEANEKLSKAKTLMMIITLLSCLSISSILLYLAYKIVNSVSSIADRLTGAGSQVASAVEQLNEAGNSLSQSSTEAAASLEETVAALEEMSSMVQMNSDNAKQAAALSSSSREAAETGEREIKTLIESMTEISKSSKKIEEIIHVIDDIAFQTNLLALNAAVEAARAGEQGKGFAVVAEAVRTLAQRSAAAAKDITVLIKDSVAQIDQGSKVADKSGTVLSNIVNSVKKVSDLNTEIAAASSEQTTGIQQISKAMNQLDQAAQSNAASAEEIAATSGEINNLATTNQNLTTELNAVILGSDSSIVPSANTSHEKPKVKRPSPVMAKIIPLKQKAPTATPPTSSQEIIPFDDDNRAKVGNTDGF